MNEAYSASVSAGAVVLFPEGMPGQQREDVLYSVLLAQLVANKRFLNVADSSGWHDTYLEVLKDSWLSTWDEWDSFSPEKHSQFTILEWVHNALKKCLSDQLVSDAACAVTNVAQLPGTVPAIQLLCEHTQASIVSETKSPSDAPVYRLRLLIIVTQAGPLLNSVYVEFKTTQPIELNPLAQVFCSDKLVGNVASNIFQANLSAELHASRRGPIIKKLGDHARKKIAAVTHLDEKGQCRIAGEVRQ